MISARSLACARIVAVTGAAALSLLPPATHAQQRASQQASQVIAATTPDPDSSGNLVVVGGPIHCISGPPPIWECAAFDEPRQLVLEDLTMIAAEIAKRFLDSEELEPHEIPENACGDSDLAGWINEIAKQFVAEVLQCPPPSLPAVFEETLSASGPSPSPPNAATGASPPIQTMHVTGEPTGPMSFSNKVAGTSSVGVETAMDVLANRLGLTPSEREAVRNLVADRIADFPELEAPEERTTTRAMGGRPGSFVVETGPDCPQTVLRPPRVDAIGEAVMGPGLSEGTCCDLVGYKGTLSLKSHSSWPGFIFTCSPDCSCGG